jgi:hypothetical protein
MMRASFAHQVMRGRPQVIDSIERIMMRIMRITLAHHQGAPLGAPDALMRRRGL